MPGNEERLGSKGVGRRKEEDWNFCFGITAELVMQCRCAYSCFTGHWDSSVMAVQTGIKQSSNKRFLHL